MWRVLVLVAGLVAVAHADIYAGKLDSIDIHAFLGNKRLLQAYIKCMLGIGSCTPEGKEMKARLKDALESRCDICSEVHKEKLRVVIGYIINEEEDYWNQLVALYDPDMKYSKRYEKELKTLKKT